MQMFRFRLNCGWLKHCPIGGHLNFFGCRRKKLMKTIVLHKMFHPSKFARRKNLLALKYSFRGIAILVNPLCFVKIEIAEFLVCTGLLFGFNSWNAKTLTHLTWQWPWEASEEKEPKPKQCLCWLKSGKKAPVWTKEFWLGHACTTLTSARTGDLQERQKWTTTTKFSRISKESFAFIIICNCRYWPALIF